MISSELNSVFSQPGKGHSLWEVVRPYVIGKPLNFIDVSVSNKDVGLETNSSPCSHTHWKRKASRINVLHLQRCGFAFLTGYFVHFVVIMSTNKTVQRTQEFIFVALKQIQSSRWQ